MEGFNEHGEEGWNEEINYDDEEVLDEDELYNYPMDAEESYSERARRQIESDDPNLVELKIERQGYILRDWERDGKSIGRNTQLKELEFSIPYGEEAEEDVRKFFHGVANNRSIKIMKFCGCNLLDGELFSILIPFFKNNCNFECLEIHWCGLGRDGFRLVASVLADFDSLVEFLFCFSTEQDDELQEIVQALAVHSGLKKLVLSCVTVGRNGCTALATLLRNQNSELAVLNLSDSDIDEGAAVLAIGLSGNRTLKDLNLSCNRTITETGWRAIFTSLHSPSCRLEKLDLRANCINDDTAISLGNALTINRSMRSLNISSNSGITIAGWHALFEFLQSPTCMLEELDLRSNGFGHEVSIALANCLTNNRSLRSLNLSRNREITIAGWRALIAYLQSPHSALESLDLSMSGINDQVVNSLTNALANNTRLRELRLYKNLRISATGWEAFSTVLQSSDSALEKLDLSLNKINDATAISLAHALSNNTKLKELLLDFNSHITTAGWAAFETVLCNTSSIMDTFRSNHTLQKLHEHQERLPTYVRMHLQLNQEYSEFQAARQKIINCHFTSENLDMQPFAEMEWKVLPHAIAWMGRDDRSNELNEYIYGFIRSMPSLFDINGRGK